MSKKSSKLGVNDSWIREGNTSNDITDKSPCKTGRIVSIGVSTRILLHPKSNVGRKKNFWYICKSDVKKKNFRVTSVENLKKGILPDVSSNRIKKMTYPICVYKKTKFSK